MAKRRRFLALFGLGLVGIAIVPLDVIPMLRNAPPSNLPPGAWTPPFPVLVVLSLVNPTLLLALAVWAGCKCARSVGLVSFVDERVSNGTPVWPRLKPALLLACLTGLAVALLTTALDAAFKPLMGVAWAVAESKQARDTSALANLVTGLTYGGITEELMLRWGFMSTVAYTVWRLTRRGAAPLGPAKMWSAILLAALVFGIGHLPAVHTAVPLTTVVVMRTVALNALAGVAFGWLFWRRGLEVAMVAHASTHVGFALLDPLFG